MMFKFLKERLKLLSSLSPKVKALLKLSFSLSVVFELVKVLPPLIFKIIIDNLVSYDPSAGISLQFIAVLIGGYFASLLAMTAIEFISLRLMINKITDAEVDVLSKAFMKLMKLDLSYHENNNTGNSISKVIRGSHRIVEVLFNIMDNLFPILLQTTVTAIILFASSFEVALSFVIVVPIFIALLIYDSKKTQTVREKYHEYYDAFSGNITQAVSNIKTVKDFGNEEKELKKAEQLIGQYNHYVKMRTKIGTINMLIEGGLVNFARLVTLGLSVWLMVEQRISPGTLVFIMTMTEKAYVNLWRLSRVYYGMQDAEPGIQRFKGIFDEKIMIEDKTDSRHKIERGELEFKNVDFRYGNSRSCALKNITFNIKPKSVTAFVGRSGAGKSTITKLLLRHFETTGGKITIDGKNIEEYSFKNLRGGIAVVSQDVELFDDTILANITYGVERSSREEVIRAAKMAHAHEFIMSFQKGYDTVIGERGVRLSGGQKQRIAIARAILKKPKILIFDEATSSLDSESERFIHHSIFKLIGKVTLIIIAHRFSTIEHAEQIILLENGEVKEIGSHKELLKKKGIFHNLRELQKLGEVK